MVEPEPNAKPSRRLPRLRFGLNTIFWLSLLFAVCASWYIQWSRERWIRESEWRLFQERAKQLEQLEEWYKAEVARTKALKAKLIEHGIKP